LAKESNEVEPAAQYVPEMHAVQEEAPVVEEYVPAAHVVQVEEPEPEYFPAAQALQEVAPAAENVPAAHVRHEVVPEYVPAKQVIVNERGGAQLLLFLSHIHK